MPIVTDDYKKPNADIAKEIAAQYEQQTTGESGKYQFPTEILELPSKGWFYPAENPLSSGKVEMKYMTAKEEDILTTQSYIKQGVVLDKLFQSMIVGNGEGKRVNYQDLLLCDKNAIMITARILGYGKDYDVEIETPSGNQQKETVDLTRVENIEVDFDTLPKNVNEFEFTLPVSKRTVTYKLLSHREQAEIEEEVKRTKKISGGTDTLLSTKLIHSIVSVDGNKDKAIIRNFVSKELLAADSRALRAYIKMMTPDVNLELEFTDEETGDPFRATLPIGVDFFWPTT